MALPSWLLKVPIHSPCILAGKRPGSQKSTFIFLTYPTALQLFFNTVDDEYNTIFAKLTKKNYLRLWKRLFPIRFWEFGDEQQFSLAPKTTKNLPWYVPVWKLHVFFPFDKTTAIWILIKKKKKNSDYIQHEGVIIAKDLKFSNENWTKLSWHNTQTLQKLFIT